MTDLVAHKVAESSEIADAYDAFSADLVRFATVLVGPDDAADIVSSAILCVLDVGNESIRNHRAYLFQAVANEARNWKRGEARRRVREDRNSHRSDVVHPAETYPEVRSAVEDLSVRQRAVIYLTYWEDLKDQTVADHLGISAGSVRRHLARARKKLRGVLDENN